MIEILTTFADSNGDWLTFFNTVVLLLAFRDRIFSKLTLGSVDQHVTKVRDLAERIQSDTQFLRGVAVRLADGGRAAPTRENS